MDEKERVGQLASVLMELRMAGSQAEAEHRARAVIASSGNEGPSASSIQRAPMMPASRRSSWSPSIPKSAPPEGSARSETFTPRRERRRRRRLAIGLSPWLKRKKARPPHHAGVEPLALRIFSRRALWPFRDCGLYSTWAFSARQEKRSSIPIEWSRYGIP